MNLPNGHQFPQSSAHATIMLNVHPYTYAPMYCKSQICLLAHSSPVK